MKTNKKQTIRVSIVIPDMQKTELIMGKMTDKAMKMFVRCYGDIIELTKVNGQEEAITSLA